MLELLHRSRIRVRLKVRRSRALSALAESPRRSEIALL